MMADKIRRTTLRDLLDSIGTSRWLVVTLLTSGFLMRFLWAFQRQRYGENGEAENVAIAVATGHGFADPYFVGSGPTAHLMPTTPLFAGGVMRLFGVHSPVADTLLTGVALAEISLAYLMGFILLGRLGGSRTAQIAALAWLCLVPPFLYQEALSFQYWDGGLALALGIGALLHVTKLADQAQCRMIDDIGAGALASLTFFVSPIVGLAVVLCYVLFYMTRRSVVVRVRAGLIASLILVALVTPWALRNANELGHPIPLRDNAGLELAIANHDAALSDRAGMAVFYDRLREVHPMQDGPGRVALRREGEIAYYKGLSDTTLAWISKNPWSFVRLFVRHVRQMYFPSDWELGHTLTVPRALIISVINAIGLTVIASALASRRQHWIYPAIFVATVAIGYGPFQPVSRYLYPIYILLTLCAADGATRLIGCLRRALPRSTVLE